jgi:lysophospholipase L1-like esterase
MSAASNANSCRNGTKAAKLCVNNAWSGSVVTDVRMYETRAKNLHNEMEEVDPDVIVILMGVNDYGGGKQLGDYDGTGELPDYPASFSECYGKMLETILATYKRADVYCCKFMNLRTGGTGLVTEQHYNAAIETLANHYGVNLIDLNSLPEFSPEQIFNHTVDGLHPNSKGMKAMADKVIAEIKANS